MTAPLPILYVSHVSVLGGAERSLLDLVTGLDRSRFAPLVALPDEGPLRRALGNVPCFRVPLHRLCRTRNALRLVHHALTVLGAGMQIRRIARRHAVAVLHANSTTAQFAVRFASATTGIPAVWHCRDLAPLPPLARQLAAGKTRVVAISNAVAAHLRGGGLPPNRIVRIYNGINTTGPHGSPGMFRSELGLSRDHVLYGMIGQLVPWKRHELFLDAAAIIAAEQPAARFAVVGADLFGDHPAYLPSLQARASRAGLSDRVVFPGYREDIADVMLDLDVVVHPAAREPFGRVVAEAMALARPVVAVDAAGPGELIEHEQTGLLVPPESPQALARAALRLSRDTPLAARLGQAARARIETDFSLGAFLDRMEQLYRTAG